VVTNSVIGERQTRHQQKMC